MVNHSWYQKLGNAGKRALPDRIQRVVARIRSAFSTWIIGLLLINLQAFAQIPGTIERLAQQPGGGPPNNWVAQPHFSYDGRFVMFSSRATDLLPGMPPPGTYGNDPNYSQWYVFDRTTKVLDRVSINNQGIPQQGPALEYPEKGTWAIDISRDGRYVVYNSEATNLVPNDTNNNPDIFMFDRQTRTVKLVSANSLGQQSRLAAQFPRFANRQASVVAFYWFNRLTAETTIAVKHLASGVLEPFSLTGSGPAIRFASAPSDGAAFATCVTALDILYRCDLRNGEQRLVSFDAVSNPVRTFGAKMTPDGSTIVFYSGAPDMIAGQPSNGGQLYVWRAENNAIERVTRSNEGWPSSGGISGFDFNISDDGNRVVWNDFDSGLAGFEITPPELFVRVVYLRDLQRGETYHAFYDLSGRIGARWGTCEDYGDPFNIGPPPLVNINQNCPAISGNGAVLGFSSYSDKWTAGDLTPPSNTATNVSRYLDVFIKDTAALNAQRVPVRNPASQLLLAGLILGIGMWAARGLK